MKRLNLAIPATLFAAGAFANPAHALEYTASPGGTPIDLVGDDTPEYLFYSGEGSVDALVASDIVQVAQPYLQGKLFSGNLVGPQSNTPYYPTSATPGLSKSQDTADGYYGLYFTAASPFTPNEQQLKTAAFGPPTEYSGYVYIDRNGTHITDLKFQVANAVPEPASWAMMILGMGVTGAALRQRRRSETLAAA